MNNDILVNYPPRKPHDEEQSTEEERISTPDHHHCPACPLSNNYTSCSLPTLLPGDLSDMTLDSSIEDSDDNDDDCTAAVVVVSKALHYQPEAAHKNIKLRHRRQRQETNHSKERQHHAIKSNNKNTRQHITQKPSMEVVAFFVGLILTVLIVGSAYVRELRITRSYERRLAHPIYLMHDDNLTMQSTTTTRSNEPLYHESFPFLLRNRQPESRGSSFVYRTTKTTAREKRNFRGTT